MSSVLLVEQVRNVYRISFRPNDEELSVSKVLDFVEYCLAFYGHGGIYDYGFTFDEVCQGLIKRFSYRPSMDFDGDTVDREYVREMVFEIREQRECA
jgi:hypothetical protein